MPFLCLLWAFKPCLRSWNALCPWRVRRIGKLRYLFSSGSGVKSASHAIPRTRQLFSVVKLLLRKLTETSVNTWPLLLGPANSADNGDALYVLANSGVKMWTNTSRVTVVAFGCINLVDYYTARLPWVALNAEPILHDPRGT